ncbi:class I SAM-dependent methyltransferase [Blastopirellula retiformator]|uniref:Methyltransferase domain protein n=1 Tax=Blastopirellula retiformator TaxID=2527970 RepID=A0A5C5UTF1_9BACT|nr:methyltransferase domain-containing protein [Blastopirellula retiformator]TWT29694.1 Methyltransferase domain protein [Blastopirellula retiformator]
MIDVSKIDFIDYGCKFGGSFSIGYRLGGKRGLGFDILPHVVDEAVRRGHQAVVGDATDLAIPDNSVRFSIMSHFLEHLPDLESVEKAIATALRVSTDCIFLRGPMFDDEYLANLGLKTYWSDWTGHPCHLTDKQLEAILAKLGVARSSYRLNWVSPIRSSRDKTIHPLDSPKDQHGYVAKKHPPKPFVVFDQTLYREWVCIVLLNNDRRLYSQLYPGNPIMRQLTWWGLVA